MAKRTALIGKCVSSGPPAVTVIPARRLAGPSPSRALSRRTSFPPRLNIPSPFDYEPVSREAAAASRTPIRFSAGVREQLEDYPGHAELHHSSSSQQPVTRPARGRPLASRGKRDWSVTPYPEAPSQLAPLGGRALRQPLPPFSALVPKSGRRGSASQLSGNRVAYKEPVGDRFPPRHRPLCFQGKLQHGVRPVPWEAEGLQKTESSAQFEAADPGVGVAHSSPDPERPPA
ncbi:PREDICTED: uncharacterized protein LOC101382631 [Odobenus rosmarus divergens]|uniref:Uncharacterized protein LOC101382631 n=1 Tax=Odobenus rosmarus divergens TaxID=9708 RepID=A0A9B0LNQ7_ODORO